ncbi:hypothetical protein [Brucella intermedia]|uniref:hypothetical protein n=1 Tax=Brucella intermedia TaxID=94625 RepID=UPI00235F4F30|nr:hypothetical protein [Brucella intermedia]
MIVMPIDPPTLQLDISELVDWLELTALFSEFGIARIDSLMGSLRQLSEEQEEDIGEEDRAIEEIIDGIEAEVEKRSRHLEVTYPFKLGEGAEELSIVEDWNAEVYSFYLVALIASHVTKSPILNTPPSEALITRLRNRVFQILSTLALAGLANGPAVSVGWPRVSGEALTDLLQRASEAGAGFTVRVPPGQYIAPREKDGGIDIIAWGREVEPPPAILYFGQVASGRNWEEKPVGENARTFIDNYLHDIMVGNHGHATIIPFRIWDDRKWKSEHRVHRALLERLRLPAKAYRGLELSREGVLVDEADQIGIVINWLEEYRNEVLH